MGWHRVELTERLSFSLFIGFIGIPLFSFDLYFHDNDTEHLFVCLINGHLYIFLGGIFCPLFSLVDCVHTEL